MTAWPCMLPQVLQLASHRWVQTAPHDCMVPMASLHVKTRWMAVVLQKQERRSARSSQERLKGLRF